MADLTHLDCNDEQEVVLSEQSKELNELILALSKAQSELESAKKDQTGYGYNYSDLNQVILTAKPILAKNGLAISQLLGNDAQGNPSVKTMLLHSSGQYIGSTIALPAIDMKGCNPVQGAGATISYLRRYAYQSILGMSSEDNDASSNGPTSKSSPSKSESKPQSFRRKKKVETDDEF